MSIYSQNILEHYKNPQNKKRMDDADISEENANRSCWDQIKVYLKIKDNKLEKLSFEWDWCAVSMASASILTEELIWMKAKEVLLLWLEDIQDMLWIEVWANRIKCSLLALESLQKGIKKIM